MPARGKKKQTILLFDNDSELANSIKIYLEDTYAIWLVDNVENLISEIKKKSFDFLISDFNSIYTHFSDNIDKIRFNSPDTKIVLMCTFFDAEIKNERTILRKVDDYIFKPFNVNLLKNKLAKLQNPKRAIAISS